MSRHMRHPCPPTPVGPFRFPCSTLSCSPALRNRLRFRGGADGVRTHDLLVANQALSQLSYGPIRVWSSECGVRSERPRHAAVHSAFRTPHSTFRLVGPDGFEPSTSPLSGARSSQLSYEPTEVDSIRTGRASLGLFRGRVYSAIAPQAGRRNIHVRSGQPKPMQDGSVLTVSTDPLGVVV